LPPLRPLRVYAFDPSLGRRFGNDMTVRVPYETLRPGPRGFALEVIDYDAANRLYYAPVNLDEPDILLQGGLSPSEANPQFHQQMVYAVAARTLDNFTRALGRPVRWSARRGGGTRLRPRPLRLYPHAMNEANAYYDPQRHAILFGYFRASEQDAGASLPGQTVFTCLSHDIVAHETSHALLNDIRHFYMEPTGPDTLAFHEAFADIVALFQHFAFREALKDHVLRSGGALFRSQLAPQIAPGPEAGAPAISAQQSTPNVLVGLAQQFGEALGTRRALRSALGAPPDPRELERRFEAHERGAVLVAAVFDAFFSAYAHRLADLLRIARLQPGESLSLELANRLVAEAVKTADHFGAMCIRALDYCPPVDITFGDFLRALITADSDLVPDDDLGYRDVLIEAFRRRGIRPGDVASYSESSLLWQPAEGPSGRPLKCRGLDFDLIWGTPPDKLAQNAQLLAAFGQQHARRLGLDPGRKPQPWTFHPVHRVGPDGQLKVQVVAELIQLEQLPLDPRRKASPRMPFRGGVTLVLDAREGTVEYAIFKRVASKTRVARQREFWAQARAVGIERYVGDAFRPRADFAALHRGY